VGVGPNVIVCRTLGAARSTAAVVRRRNAVAYRRFMVQWLWIVWGARILL
jgi:hypothetical protein